MRAALLTRYTERTGSSRVRVFQFVPYLERAGVEVRTLDWAVTGRADLARYIVEALRVVRWADVVLLQKPCQPPWLLRLLARANPNLVVDFDDAVWAPTTNGADARNERYGERLRCAVGLAHTVTAGSEYLARWAAQTSPGAEVEVLRPSVDLTTYRAEEPESSGGLPTIGWVGNPGNFQDFTASAVSGLRTFIDSGRARCKIVSSRPLEVDGLRCDFEPWSSEGEVEALRAFDIGIMPLLDTERSRGRCGFKAVQYQAVGVPVVASNVVGAVEVIDDTVTGFNVTGSAEWESRLGALVADAALRKKMGQAGRRRVEQNYSVQVNLPRLLDVLDRAARSSRHR
ncbi:MAG: glycosyltransferase family 4 protein [Acidimicrobiia bacterium]